MNGKWMGERRDFVAGENGRRGREVVRFRDLRIDAGSQTVPGAGKTLVSFRFVSFRLRRPVAALPLTQFSARTRGRGARSRC